MNGGELEDLQLALAVGCDHCGGVANLFAEEGAAYWRSGGEQALGYVRFLAGDELVGELLVLGGVEDDDG